MEVQDRVAQLSASSIDRALRPYRTRGKRRGVSTTRPGTLLKQQIAMRTFAEWTEQQPGFFEMDLVAHCGWSGAGQFLYTLSLVDVATGWVTCAGLRHKRSETVFGGLQRLQAELPFPILGLDSDNGSEFINQVMLAYCQTEAITFTRSRPYRKNDGCHVEQIPLCQVVAAAPGQQACHWCQMRRTRCRLSARRASRAVRPSCCRRAM